MQNSAFVDESPPTCIETGLWTVLRPEWFLRSRHGWSLERKGELMRRLIIWLTSHLTNLIALFVAIIRNAVNKPAGQERSICLSSEKRELRIVLIGKTGTGKSATGNTILGKENFVSRFDFNPVTQTCQSGDREWNSKRIVMIDTPAISDSGFPEIGRCLHLASPGPHVLVLVTQMGRFTEKDYQSAEQVKEVFGQEAKKHMIVVFTRSEDLRSKSLEEYVEHTDNQYLRQVIKACSNRYCGFNNSATSEQRERHAEELLTLIEEMVQKNHGRI